ncbi:MAG: ABC transporter ATP-binding protein [Planctomycetota bacterium]
MSIAQPSKVTSPSHTLAPVISASGLSHRYGDRLALDGVDLCVGKGEVVAVLGRNGSGKTTLFRLLSTQVPLSDGVLSIAGHDVRTSGQQVRQKMGVIFQSPSLDLQLTVQENLHCQGALYGLSGLDLRQRARVALERFGLLDRADDRCQTLSGGLKRRVELAKGLLHRPEVLLLDEPSTGLDPAARLNLWATLEELAAEGVAVLLTTHLMEEAEKASRIVIMHEGCKVADQSPAELRTMLGGQVLTVHCDQPKSVAQALRDSWGISADLVDGKLCWECDDVAVVNQVMSTVGDQLRSITLAQPSLHDAFIRLTGTRLDLEPTA